MELWNTFKAWLEKYIVPLSVGVGIGSLLFILIGYGITGHLFKNDFDHNYLSAFGDFLSGFLGAVFGMITIYLVYKTFKSQKVELEEQRKLLDAQQEEIKLSRIIVSRQLFESSFLELLKQYKEELSKIDDKKIELVIKGFRRISEENNNLTLKSFSSKFPQEINHWGKEGSYIFMDFFYNFYSLISYMSSKEEEVKDMDVYYTIISNTLKPRQRVFLILILEYAIINILKEEKTENSIRFLSIINKFTFYKNLIDTPIKDLSKEEILFRTYTIR